MIWQRARELGALPDGLIKPNQVFKWKTLEPWADEITEAEALAETSAPAATGRHESLSGVRVAQAGKSQEVVTDRDMPRRRKPGRAETP